MAPTWLSRSEGIENASTVLAAPPPLLMTQTKAELRDRMRSERKRLKAALPRAAKDAASHLHSVLGALTFEVRCAAVYLPIGSELDTGPLAAELRRRGVRLALPRVDAADTPLSFRAWRPGDALEADVQGCAAPPASAETEQPDLIFLPLVAFDRRGHRLGQGGGYYDRTLEALSGHSRPAFIGLAYAGQEAPGVPHDPHDQKLDGVLTERGYMPARRDV